MSKLYQQPFKIQRKFAALCLILCLEGCALRHNGTGPTPYQRAVYLNKSLSDAALAITTSVPILAQANLIDVDLANNLMRYALAAATASSDIAGILKSGSDKQWNLMAAQIAGALAKIPASNAVGAFLARIPTVEKMALAQTAVTTIISTIQVFTVTLKE